MVSILRIAGVPTSSTPETPDTLHFVGIRSLGSPGVWDSLCPQNCRSARVPKPWTVLWPPTFHTYSLEENLFRSFHACPLNCQLFIHTLFILIQPIVELGQSTKEYIMHAVNWRNILQNTFCLLMVWIFPNKCWRLDHHCNAFSRCCSRGKTV